MLSTKSFEQLATQLNLDEEKNLSRIDTGALTR